MKAKIVGVQRVRGIAKASGNAFDFARVNVLTPVEVRASEKFTSEGHGFEVVEYELRLDALPKFSGLSYPAEVELETEIVPDRRGPKVVVTGVKGGNLRAAS